MNESLYLYGFVPADAAAPPAAIGGVGDAPVELLEEAGVVAVVSRVDAEEYGEQRLQERLQDLDWVARQGVAHERVVAWFVDHARIVPVRLFTLYSGETALRQEAARRADRIREHLRRFEGRREWDLKVAYRPDRLEARLADVSDEVLALDTAIEAATPGKRFLLQRKRAELVRVETARAARRLARELFDALAAGAVQALTIPPPREAEGAAVVLAGALLLQQNREAEVRRLAAERAAELAEVGIDVAFSGPWAPYRFLDQETPA